MKICVVTPRFAISGVPLAQIRFAKALAHSGHDVDLLIGCINDGVRLPEIEGVRVLGKSRVLWMIYTSCQFQELRSQRWRVCNLSPFCAYGDRAFSGLLATPDITMPKLSGPLRGRRDQDRASEAVAFHVPTPLHITKKP